MTSSKILSPTVVNMQQAFKVALSMALVYWLALSLNWDLPKYGALAIALISLDTSGASLQKGMMRMVGTTVGLAVGLLGLALFAQDSWMTLVYQASYLVVVGYFMQSSRYPYAWYVAGFLPSLVWATTYGKIDGAFSYATFRYLETSAGIVIYTAVSILVWPRHAGDKLNRQGDEFWQELQDLFRLYRRQLEDGQLPADAQARRAKLAGTVPKMLATLEAAYADTPSVAAQKRAWELFRVNARAIGNAMELWRQSIDDCCHLDLDRFLPDVRYDLDKVGSRLDRIDHLWKMRSAGEEVSDVAGKDESLLEWRELAVGRERAAELSHLDRAALLNFAQQLNLLHLTSSELLRTMRVLAGLAPVSDLNSHTLPPDLYQSSRWDPVRFASGLLPAVCFSVAFFYWIYFNPPTGPSVPNMAATFGLMVVLTPMNAATLIPRALIAIWAFVAPVYFLVMPRLSTGPELLTLVFVFVFLASILLAGRLAALRTVTLVLFVMMTGISNDQSYSFSALIDGALMMLLALCVVAIVQTIVSPLKPERTLLKSIRRFFRGCGRVIGGYALDELATESAADRARGRRYRKRYFESMVLPEPAKIQAAHAHLDSELYPDNPAEKVERLIDALESIANRVQSLEIANRRISSHASELPESFLSSATQMQKVLQSVFTQWERLEPDNTIEQQISDLKQIAHDMQQRFNDLRTISGQHDRDDRLLADLYAMLGSVRGLIEAMANTQVVINQINWQQWAAPRF